MHLKKLSIAFALFAITTFSQSVFAQGLNWEGQTGAVITPFAYTAASPANKFGKPEVSFHYMNSGNVIGNDYQFSITEGICKHFELASRSPSALRGDSPLSSLFANGYTDLHGKLTFVQRMLSRPSGFRPSPSAPLAASAFRAGSSYFPGSAPE